MKKSSIVMIATLLCLLAVSLCPADEVTVEPVGEPDVTMVSNHKGDCKH